MPSNAVLTMTVMTPQMVSAGGERRLVLNAFGTRAGHCTTMRALCIMVKYMMQHGPSTPMICLSVLPMSLAGWQRLLPVASGAEKAVDIVDLTRLTCPAWTAKASMPPPEYQVCWLQLRFMSALTEGADSASAAAPASQQVRESYKDRGADAEELRDGLQSQLQSLQQLRQQQQQQMFQANQQEPRFSQMPEQRASLSEAQESTPLPAPGIEASGAGIANQTGSDRREQETIEPAGLEGQFRGSGIRLKAAPTTAGKAQAPAIFPATMPFSDEPPLADSIPTQESEYLPDRVPAQMRQAAPPAPNGYQHEDPWASSSGSAQTSALPLDSFQTPSDPLDSAFIAAEQDIQENSSSGGYPLNGDSRSGYPSKENTSARRRIM